MDEAEIRELVESRKVVVSATASWYTPAGNERSAPIYEAEVENEYLKKSRTIKARCTTELESKIQQCVETWAEQEIRKRVVESKRDAKSQAQAEVQVRDAEAKEQLVESEGLLAATLSIDDRIDWQAEQDTRKFREFSFPQPPAQPTVEVVSIPPRPGLTWLFRGRLRRWESRCEEIARTHEESIERAGQEWRDALAAHEQAHKAAKEIHEKDRAHFVSEQERFNHALSDFQKRFEGGDISAVIEYCSRVLERSQYPDWVVLNYKIDFDAESRFVTVELEMPSSDKMPATAGYKFVARGNRVEPTSLKAKEVTAIHESVLDQLVLRTVHEILEACYTDQVKGVLLNGWVTSVDKATGKDKRVRVRSLFAERTTFEGLDLARVCPATCIERLKDGAGEIDQVQA